MYFEFEGGKISFYDRGEGVAVVLVHGYLETAGSWNGFAVKLAERYRVITVDLPGHGGSDTFGTVHTMEFMASVIKALAAHLQLDRFFLAGHSMGGYVTLAFAGLYPEILNGYCLFHSQPFEDTPEAREKRKRELALVEEGRKDEFIPANISAMYAASTSEKQEEAIRRSVALASGLSPGGIIAVLNGMLLRPNRLSVMESGELPCLWILGAHDKYIPAAVIQTRVKLAACSRVAVLDSSGHMGFIEEEDRSVALVSEFIDELAR